MAFPSDPDYGDEVQEGDFIYRWDGLAWTVVSSVPADPSSSIPNADFPINPTIGQRYAFSGQTWEWDGVAWILVRARYVSWADIGDKPDFDQLYAALVGGNSFDGNQDIVGNVDVTGTVTIVGTITADEFIGDVEWANLIGVPSTFPPSAHTHTESEIVDLDKYTQAEVDLLFVASYDYIDTNFYTVTEVNSNFLSLSGGTMTGALTLSGLPTVPLHAATKGYIDNNFLALAGGTLTGALTLSGDPSSALHAATKQYVDAADASLQDDIDDNATDILSLETDVATKMEFKGTWSAGTYLLNDVVLRNGVLYICNAASTTGTPGSSGDWTVLTGTGALIEVETMTISSPVADVTSSVNLSGFRKIVVVGYELARASSVTTLMRVGDSGGILSSSIYYSGEGSASTSHNVGTASGGAFRSFTAVIENFNQALVKPITYSGSISGTNMPTLVNSTAVLDRVQVFGNAANLTGGTVKIFGVA